MPLVIISGYPSSGKTRRSRQILDAFQSKITNSSHAQHTRLTVSHINGESLGLSRDVYRDARSEKDARATEYFAVKRALSRDTVVIADGLNYIKGFRYQLYCEAKALQTPSCVVHIGTPVEKCRELNKRSCADGKIGAGYSEDVFENLAFRYEEPNGMTRWDSPLFTVPFDDVDPPYDAIWDAIVGTEGDLKRVKPNQATVLAPATEPDYLYDLDKSSQEILNMIQDWQKDHQGEGGGAIPAFETMIQLPAAPLSTPQLQRLRRQFVALNRQHKLPKQRIRTSFVEYLNDNFR